MKLKDLKNLSVREKILISSLIMVVIAVMGFLLGVKPLQAKLEEKFTSIDISMVYGGQPVYYYIISIE